MRARIISATLITLFLASMLSVAFTQLAMGHTAEDPFVTDLIASQTIDVGDVSVWNDGEHLYVKYETVDDWSLTSTHLAVATSLAAIPHTAKGSPIPGQFEYSASHDPGTMEYTYAIDLNGWNSGTLLYIAAHAVVSGPGATSTPAQGLLITVPLLIWSQGYDIGTITVSIEGENLVIFTTITLTGWKILATHLYIGNTPPIYPPPWETFPYKHEPIPELTDDTYVIPLADIGAGCNDVLYISLHANVKYEFPWGTIYKDAWSEESLMDGWQKYFSITIPCMPVSETAWGNGLRFPGKSWAMYFTYTVQ